MSLLVLYNQPSGEPLSGTTFKIWNGSAWVIKVIKRWNGSAWVAATLKRWNGTAWIVA